MVRRITLVTVLLLLAWGVMVFSHEVGHLLGGWMGGATLTDADLVPWRLPYSLHQPDPHPRLTLWAGPLFGTLAPTLIALAARQKWCWFVADFCWLANGTYLAVAWWSGEPSLDTPRMLDAGVHPFAIAAFCGVTIGVGYIRFRADCIAMFGDAAKRRPTPKRDTTGEVR